MHIGQTKQLDEIAHLEEAGARPAEIAQGLPTLKDKARVTVGGHVCIRIRVALSTTLAPSVSGTMARREAGGRSDREGSVPLGREEAEISLLWAGWCR